MMCEEGKVIIEQFELGALLESTLPCLYLVIYFSEFLQETRSAGKTNEQATVCSRLPRPGTS